MCLCKADPGFHPGYAVFNSLPGIHGAPPLLRLAALFDQPALLVLREV